MHRLASNNGTSTPHMSKTVSRERTSVVVSSENLMCMRAINGISDTSVKLNSGSFFSSQIRVYQSRKAQPIFRSKSYIPNQSRSTELNCLHISKPEYLHNLNWKTHLSPPPLKPNPASSQNHLFLQNTKKNPNFDKSHFKPPLQKKISKKVITTNIPQIPNENLSLHSRF